MVFTITPPLPHLGEGSQEICAPPPIVFAKESVEVRASSAVILIMALLHPGNVSSQALDLEISEAVHAVSRFATVQLHPIGHSLHDACVGRGQDL